MRISDWSSDVCFRSPVKGRETISCVICISRIGVAIGHENQMALDLAAIRRECIVARENAGGRHKPCRSEEHTSELQSLMRISYAVFCLKKKKTYKKIEDKKNTQNMRSETDYTY